MPVVQIALSDQDKETITKHVNQYRALHNSPPLVWDNTIAGFADNWSSFLLKNSAFYHSNNTMYGENLAYFQGYTATPVELILKSIDLWYDEIRMYDFNVSQYTSGTGHFTCLVWKASRSHGFGYSYNTTTKEVIVSMNTSPPGNIIGEFKENVLPLVTSIDPGPEPMPEPMPEPIPEPMPLPVPVPVPTPLPIIDNETEPNEYETIKYSLISQLYHVIYKIQSRAPKYVIRNLITNVYNTVYTIPDEILPRKYQIMNALRNILMAVKYRYSKYIIIRIINNIVYDLTQSISLQKA